jgi:mannose-6-phosphate isomerase-like protein (cupin superfamily)
MSDVADSAAHNRHIRGSRSPHGGNYSGSMEPSKPNASDVAGYTLTNLRDVQDQAPSFGMAPNVEARFARQALELERGGLSHLRLAPGFRMPFGHDHVEQEEIYVVLAGSGRFKLDDDVVDVRPLDALRVPPGTTRCYEAGAEGLEFVVFGAPRAPGSSNDARMVPDWWDDA